MNDKIIQGDDDDDANNNVDDDYGNDDKDDDYNDDDVLGETIPVSPRPGCLSSCLHNQAVSTG